jgi:hypothetical protein
MEGVSSETPSIKEEYDQRRKTMKFRTVVILALALVLLLAVAVPASAGRPTQKIRYAHKSDATVTPVGVSTPDSFRAAVGDRNTDHGSRMVVKFALNGVKIDRIASAQLKLTIDRSVKDDGLDMSLPIQYPGLGNTTVIHIADYGRTASIAAYDTPSIGNDPGVVWGANNVTSLGLPPIDVTAAVIQARQAGYRFVTFRIQTVIETDNDGKQDVWYFAASERANSPQYRPTLTINLTP